jgi:hypothetical protein
MSLITTVQSNANTFYRISIIDFTFIRLCDGLLVCYDPSSIEHRQGLLPGGLDPAVLDRELNMLQTCTPLHVFPLLGCR